LKTDNCVENLTTGFQVNIYDAQDKELWNSIWTGRKLDIKFKKNFPDAARVEIKANKNYVINTMTGTRIYQDEPLQLDYKLTE
jgi:nitrous oxidase accessory protein NosD